MKYHETVPSETGPYWEVGANRSIEIRRHGCYDGERKLTPQEIGAVCPLLGPIPDTDDDAIALACEVAFARMMMQVHPRRDIPIDEVIASIHLCEPVATRFYDAERSLSLLHDMERVTRELTCSPAQ